MNNTNFDQFVQAARSQIGSALAVPIDLLPKQEANNDGLEDGDTGDWIGPTQGQIDPNKRNLCQ